MAHSWLASIAALGLVFAGLSGNALSQTGPIGSGATAPARLPAAPAVGKFELLKALQARDKHVKCRDWTGATCFHLYVAVDGKPRPVVVLYWHSTNQIVIVAPLSDPFPSGQALPADKQAEIAKLNAEIGPCEIVRIKLEYDGDSHVLATYAVVEKPASIAAFEARLSQLLESVAKTKTVAAGIG
jgi:hypothetical protein